MNKVKLVSIIIAIIGIINIFGGSYMITAFTGDGYSTLNAALTYYIYAIITILPIVFGLIGIYFSIKDINLSIIQYIIAIITVIIGIVLGFSNDISNISYYTLLGIILLIISSIINELQIKGLIKGDLIE
ncbi:MAG: hypothetical protein LBV42_00395 [Methanobrevibacter sp.]|jgi:hypothetical protein|nr:hypothetical protein [Methanobrevibacter sp.]